MNVDMYGAEEKNDKVIGSGCFNSMSLVIIVIAVILMFQYCGKKQYDPVKNFEDYMIEWKIGCDRLVEKQRKEWIEKYGEYDIEENDDEM